MDATNTDDNQDAEEVHAFNQVMEKVGYDGRFQRIYNGIFVLGLGFCGCLTFMNMILALNTPEHWCHVPGINRTNFTLDEWRTLTLPKQVDNRGAEKFSKCQMYETNYSTFQHWDYENLNSTQRKTVECQHGFEYDTEWYDRTIPTDENWVCDKELYVTNVFVVSRIMEVIGSFALGQAGDIFGRRMIYFVSVISVIIFRAISIVTVSSFTWFMITNGVVAIVNNAVFQSPMIVAMEISREDKRTDIAMLASLGWSVATTVMPLVFWWLRDWVPFMWTTTIPTAVVLIFSKYVIESPRWLIGKGRFREALAQFRKIAKVNGRQFDMNEKELSELYCDGQAENVYGIASLFSSWHIARNTAIMGFAWCVVAVCGFTLFLFSTQMGGNPFLNFLMQSVVEIPAYFVGQYFADRIGRRLTNSASFLISGITCIPIILLITDEKNILICTILTAIVKFLNAVTFFVVNLQAMEVYPTCLRQTGISISAILSNGVGVVAPYMVFLGTNVDIRYPYYILGTLKFLGVVTIFLPETLYQNLPDTLEDARGFGKDQQFFSFPKKRRSSTGNADDNASEKLNQEQYAP